MKFSRLLLIAAAVAVVRTAAFLTPLSCERRCHDERHVDAYSRRPPRSSSRSASSATTIPFDPTEPEALVSPPILDIVLFGVGDLRVDDHVGLARALQQTDNKVLPLCILNDSILSTVPGAVAHTVDTANMLAAAVQELDASLREQVHCPELFALHTVVGTSRSVTEILNDLVQQQRDQQAYPYHQVRVHVCDLGDADNRLGYGALGQLLQQQLDDSRSYFEIVTWDNALRDGPWNAVAELPEFYPEYQAKYATTTTTDAPKVPVTIPSSIQPDQVLSIDALKRLPTAEELLERFIQVLELDAARCQAEVNTGIYATHWGGLSAASIGCQTALTSVQSYVTDCNEDDTLWSRHASYPGRLSCRRNGRSLEHASMAWQLAGDGTSPTGNNNCDNNNWLAGEGLTRFLAAPLLFGTVSPRRLWHAARGTSGYFWFTSPLRRLVEGQEWHRLLAARNIQTDPAYQGNGQTVYKYWRYHGFLCRYAETDFATTSFVDEKEGVLLVHGFGASGAQWNKAMQELSQLESTALQGLAPDLIGFGQSEKPAISYTSYMWDSQVMDFCKEIAVQRNQWTSFVTGGNSIGGFTSMSFAACDTATGNEVSSSGAPGTGRCTGLVLMNSAGPVKTSEEVEQEQALAKGLPLASVAQATAMQALPVCKPPPRPVARVFGNTLLGYLRPRIQSICRNLYPTNPTAVDDDLCKGIERDSLDPGAINVMMAGAKLPPPRTANELLGADFGSASAVEGQVQESSFDGPVLIAQGVLDPLNDATDRMNRYRALREGVQTDPIQAGHCPHDELPDQVAKSIASWMGTRTPKMSPVSAKVAATTRSL